MAIGDLMGMMKQAKQLQEKMQAVQEEIAAMSVDGAAGGGLVSVTTNGKGDLKSVRIDPSLLKPEEVEILEDLIVAAMSDARGKAEAARRRQDAGDDRRPEPAARHEAAVLARPLSLAFERALRRINATDSRVVTPCRRRVLFVEGAGLFVCARDRRRGLSGRSRAVWEAVMVNVSTEAQLRNAIFAANAGGDQTIVFTSNIVLTGSLPMITASMTFQGNSFVLDADEMGRAFFVVGGTVAIDNLKIVDAVATGGAGGDSTGEGGGGGGGGLGAGAAVFVNTGATVTLTNVEIENVTALGGQGGAGGSAVSGGVGGAGGGGLGGNGGFANGNGGGGGGYEGNGGNGAIGGGGGGGEFGNGGNGVNLENGGGGGGGGQEGNGGSSTGDGGGGGGGAINPGANGGATTGGAGGSPQGGNGGDNGVDGQPGLALGGGGGGGGGADGGIGGLSGGGGGGGDGGDAAGNGGIGGGGGGASSLTATAGNGGDFGGGGGSVTVAGGSGGFGGGGGGAELFDAAGGAGGSARRWRWRYRRRWRDLWRHGRERRGGIRRRRRGAWAGQSSSARAGS